MCSTCRACDVGDLEHMAEEKQVLRAMNTEIKRRVEAHKTLEGMTESIANEMSQKSAMNWKSLAGLSR